jgi:mannose-6-phosphate isomerase-like protein (cupin superfamily)
MQTQALADSPKNHRGGGQVSQLLLAPGQFGSRNLAVTWVKAAPGSQQPLHAHPRSEQIYVIVSGRGRIIVAGEEQEVTEGTLVFIQPGAEHAIRNPGPDELVYVSATAPPFEMPTGEFAYERPGNG